MIKSTRLRSTLSASTILAAGLLLVVTPAHAQNLPDTGNVSSVTSGLSGGAPGSTNPGFSTSGAAGAQTLRVDLKDNRTILNWSGGGFKVAAGNTVDFKDARATSGVTGRTDNIAVLNRDLSGNTSNILGAIKSDANVAVYVINNAGIVFGSSSVTNTGSFFASTLDLTDANFLSTPTSLAFSGDGAGITLKPGASITASGTGSTDGGRLGDLVLIGKTIFGNETGTARTLTASGDVALIAAGGVTIQNSPGSPLSFTITAPGREALYTTVVDVNADITGRNVTVATLKGGPGNLGQNIWLDGSITATGAAVTDRGVVLTAAIAAPGVTFTAPGQSDSSAMELNSVVNSAKDINVKYGGDFIQVSKSWTAAGKLDFDVKAMNGSDSAFTAAQMVLPGTMNAAGRITVTNGDLTFHASTIGGVALNGGADVSGNIIANVSGFSAGDLVVGGSVNIQTGDASFTKINAAGPISILAQGDFTSTGLLTSTNGGITVSSGRHIVGSDFDAEGGSLSLNGEMGLKANTVYGRDGVSLISDGYGGASSIYDNGRIRIGSVSTGSSGDLYIRSLQLFNFNDGRVTSLVAGHDVNITTSFIDAGLIKGVTGSATLNANTVSSIYGNYITVDNLVAGNGISATALGGVNIINGNAGTGSLQLTAQNGAAILGSLTIPSAINAGGNITINAAGAALLRANITAGGNLSATGSTVGLGTTAFPAYQIKAGGTVDLTAISSLITANGNVSVQSNSDGIGTEALTLNSAAGVAFSNGTALFGGTARQSDVRIRSAANSAVTLSSVSARSLLGATGADPFTLGLTRNATIGLSGGTVDLVNSLYVSGAFLALGGTINVSNGDIDLHAQNGAFSSTPPSLTASRDISLTLTDPGSSVTLGSLIAGRNASIVADIITANHIEGTTGSVQLLSKGAIAVLDVIAGTDATVTSNSPIPIDAINLRSVTAGGNIAVTSANGMARVLNTTATTGNILVTAADDVILGGDSSGANGTVNAGGNIDLVSNGSVTTLTGAVTANGNISVTGERGVVLGYSATSPTAIKTKGAITITSRNGGISGSGSTGGLIVQSNSDGVGSEALTLDTLGDIYLSGQILGGNNRQSDIQVRVRGIGNLSLGGVSARGLLGAVGAAPFANGLDWGGSFAFSGTNMFTNTLRLKGGQIAIGGSIGVAAGDIDLEGTSIPVTIAGALTASRDIIVRASGGDLSIRSGTSFTGRNVVLSASNAFVNDGGANIMNASGHWLVYSAAPAGDTFGGLDSGNTAIWNGTLGTRDPSTISGNRYVFSFQPTLTFSSQDFSKVYGTDLTGSTGLPFAVTGYQPGVTGAFLGDTAATAYSGLPSFTSPGFAQRATVAGGPYLVTIGQGGLQSDAGYMFAFSSLGMLMVTPKSINANVLADNKTYDSTKDATGTVTLVGVVAGDTVGTGGTTFTFSDKNAGNGKTVNVAGTTLTGIDSGNYTLVIPTTVFADIFKKAITAGVTANNKTYDGTKTGTGSVTLNGVLAGDAVGTTGTTFTFSDKNAGIDKTVNVAGTSLTGADAGNYTFTIPASALADILKKALTAGVTANTKTYDGTMAGTGTVTLNGVVAGDAVGTSGTTFTFSDKNAGTGKTVNVAGTTLTGADAGNYTFTIPASALADILKKALTAGVTANTKTYDGTTTGAGTVTLNGVVVGDSVATSGTTFTFADKNAGTGKTVAVGGTSLTGTDAVNYTVTVPASALADILKKAITASLVANNKTYDGTTAGTGTVTLNGVVSGDAVTTSGTTFTFADKNAGIGKTVAVAGTTIGGADAGNYTITIPASVLGDILKRALAVTADDASKVQNDPDPALTFTLNSGSLVVGDAFSGGVARDTGENPGTYAIRIGTLSAGNNYTITFTPGTFTINLPLGSEGLQPALKAQPLPSQLSTDGPVSGSSVNLQTSAVCGDDKNCTTGNPAK